MFAVLLKLLAVESIQPFMSFLHEDIKTHEINKNTIMKVLPIRLPIMNILKISPNLQKHSH